MSTATPTATPTQSAPGVTLRLSILMFLQFAIQGAWLPLMFAYFNEFRGFPDSQVGLLLAAGAIGAIISPFISGQLADRHLNGEHFLAITHILGAAIVWILAEMSAFYPLLAMSFLYGVLYTPTLAVCNAVSFAHLPDRDRDFGKVRVWGTIGFIAAGITIGQWILHVTTQDKPAPTATTVTLNDHFKKTLSQAKTTEDQQKVLQRVSEVTAMRDAFRLAAILGVVLGLYSLTLPKTPPRREKHNYAPGEALQTIRRQPLISLFIIALPVAMVHQFFFARTSQFLGTLNMKAPWADKIFGIGGAGIMTVGQISEIVVLGLMPLLVKRIPRKTLLSIGLIAYAARFAVFAYLPYAWALIPALALHGFVFGCFFFLCYMIVDEQTTPAIRSSAQNLFNLVVFGLGVICGNLLSGWLGDWLKDDNGMNWQLFYAIPMYMTLACLAALWLFYPSKPAPQPQEA